MPALQCDILIEQGATFQREFTVKSQGVPISGLVNFTGRGMMRTSAGVLVVSFSVTVGTQTVLIALSAAQTAALTVPASRHKYDVEIQSPSGIVYRIAEGRVTISPEQTRPEP